MAINSFPQVAGHETVPVYFEAGMDGTYSFTATNMETIGDEVPVFLEDIDLNHIHDLRTNPEYSFNYVAGTVKTFNIHFKDVTNIDEFAQEAPLFQSLLANGRLSVHYLGKTPLEGNVTISVYNLAGQCIIEKESPQAHTEISFQGSSAMYIVHIRYNQATYSTKVFNR